MYQASTSKITTKASLAARICQNAIVKSYWPGLLESSSKYPRNLKGKSLQTNITKQISCVSLNQTFCLFQTSPSVITICYWILSVNLQGLVTCQVERLNCLIIPSGKFWNCTYSLRVYFHHWRKICWFVDTPQGDLRWLHSNKIIWITDRLIYNKTQSESTCIEWHCQICPFSCHPAHSLEQSIGP
mgnify:CR=1 FL=1